METISPLAEKERIKAVDTLRGFAILGIFLVNMQDFSSPWLYLGIGDLWKSKIDIGTQIFIDIFAQANFYTLFSMLFGFGMIIFKERINKKGLNFIPMYTRRLFVLLIFGIIHAFLIWHGDILISYALVGFLLILFHKAGNKTLLSWAFALIIFPALLISVSLFANNGGVYSRFNQTMVNKSIEVYGSGTFLEITAQRINDWSYVNWQNGLGLVILSLILLPMFLFGAYIAKKRWFHDVEQHLNTIKKVWLLSLVIAIIFKSLPYLYEQKGALFQIQDLIGGPATAIFYATSIILLMRYKWWNHKLSYLGYVGRLSLSNYLFQSLVSTTLFYGYGFGLYGKVSPFYGSLIVIIIFTIQIILSKLWLSKFIIGPAEWVWRSLTYMKVQQFKRVNNSLKNEIYPK